MAFTLETGAGVAGSNSYATGTEFDTYWEDRNDTATVNNNTDEAKEGALIKASEFLDATVFYQFGGWVGTKKTSSQGLDWPRYDAWDKDGYSISSASIPQKVKDAVCVLAKEALSAELLPSQDRGNAIRRLSQKVGSLEKETEYFDWAPSQKTYDLVWRLIGGLTRRGGGSSRALLKA